MSKLSEHQWDLLGYLSSGAVIKGAKETGEWLCRLPNGMGFKVKSTTMNALYRKRMIKQVSQDNPDYTISAVGLAVLPSPTDTAGSDVTRAER